MASSKTTTVIAWVLQVLLALVIAGAGAAKLSGDAAMLALFDDIGAGQWLRFVVGTLEVLAGAGLVIPRVRALAALGLVALLGCATLVNVIVLHASPVASLALGVVALVIAILRRSELTRAASSQPRSVTA